MFKRTLIASSIFAASLAAPVMAAETYTLDSSHSQVIFSYDHLGFSTTYGMFSGFEGTVMLDEANPAASSVEVSMSTDSLITGWDKRDAHFKASDLFNAASHPVITFKSTQVEVTGDKTAMITGDLTMNGITKPVVLDAKLNKMGMHPRANKPWAGFDATTTIKRSDWDMGLSAPFVSDEVALMISIEVQK